MAWLAAICEDNLENTRVKWVTHDRLIPHPKKQAKSLFGFTDEGRFILFVQRVQTNILETLRKTRHQTKGLRWLKTVPAHSKT